MRTAISALTLCLYTLLVANQEPTEEPKAPAQSILISGVSIPIVLMNCESALRPLSSLSFNDGAMQDVKWYERLPVDAIVIEPNGMCRYRRVGDNSLRLSGPVECGKHAHAAVSAFLNGEYWKDWKMQNELRSSIGILNLGGDEITRSIALEPVKLGG